MRPVLSVCSVAVLVVFLTVGIRSTLVLLHIRPVINGRVSAATHVVAAPHSVNNVQSVGFRGSVLNVQLAAARTWPFQQAQEPAAEVSLQPAVPPELQEYVAEPGSEPALEPALEPAFDPGLDPGLEPGLEPGSESAIEPALWPGMEPRQKKQKISQEDTGE